MHSAIRNDQRSMAMILTVMIKTVTLLSSSPKKKKRKATRDKNWMGSVSVDLQHTHRPPISSDPTKKGD